MKHLLRLVPVALLAPATVALSLAGALLHSQGNKTSIPLTRSQAHSAPPSIAEPSVQAASASQKARVAASLAKMPLLFERNQGQFAPGTEFVASSQGLELAIDSQGATLALAPPDTKPGSKSRVVRLAFVGSNAKAPVRGQHERATKINYLVGRDRKNWRTDVPTFDRVAVQGVYPGIDAVYYGNGHSLEYDFVVAPGANPNDVRLRFSGADTLHLNKHGDLVLRVGREELVQHAPVVYQNVRGRRVPVAGRYTLRSRSEVGFSLGRYNRALPLVIDPTLAYSTFVGGPINVKAMAVSGDGSVFIAGNRSINAGSIAGKAPTTVGPGGLLFVAKISSAGDKLDYLTYTGGTEPDKADHFRFEFIYGLAVDKAGNAYAVGSTNMVNLPVLHPYQAYLSPIIEDNGYSRDAFLLKLNSKGDALLYGTYLGGAATAAGSTGAYSANDEANAVAVDDDGYAYLTGSTEATAFPIVGGFQPQQTEGTEAFLAKINANVEDNLGGTKSLVYSTYLGSSSPDGGQAVAVTGQGKVYVVGHTGNGNSDEGDDSSGTPFPTRGGLLKPGTARTPGFVAEVDTLKTGSSSLVASTLLDGESLLPGDEGEPPETNLIPHGVALGADGSVYVAGVTNLSSVAGKNFLVFGTTSSSDFRSAFLLKLKGDLSSLVYADLMAGTRRDTATSVAVDSQGQAYVAGCTFSPDFPQQNPLPRIPAASSDAGNDFAAKIDSSGAKLIYLTSIGGSNTEDEPLDVESNSAPIVDLDAQGNAYVAGNTYSTDFPTTPKSLQPTANMVNGLGSGFVLKFQGEGLYVNSTGDSDDADEATKEYDGSCGTGNTLSDGQPECTLRAAIQEANHAKIKPVINFKITQGVATGSIPKISLKKPLPSLDIPMTVDGTTQPGVNRVWLNGVSAGAMSGLVVAGGDSLIKGLLINQIRGDGILVRTKGKNSIENCWVGLNDKGVADTQTGVPGAGIHILNSPGNIVGGATAEKRCVISSNRNGVWIDGATSNANAVQGCYIGTDISGTKPAGNVTYGILVGPETLAKSFKILPLNAVIGGATTTAGSGLGNVISGNLNTGVALVGVSGTRIQGNLVGTDKTGAKALANGIGVLAFRAPSNTVVSNVLSGNKGGIYLAGAETTGCTVQSNLVGTDPSGTKAVPNVKGILLVAASKNTVGGSQATRNVVSGNSDTGIYLDADSGLRPPGSYEDGAPRLNVISYNFVGVDKSGAKALPNVAGIGLGDCLGTTVSGNVVSGNSQSGMILFSRCEQNTITSNFIGTNPTGTTAIANGQYGVLMLNAQKNVLDNNTISGNGRAGLVLAGKFPSGYPAPNSALAKNLVGPINNTITRNRIGTNLGVTTAIPNGKSAGAAGAGLLVLPILDGDPFTGEPGNVLGKVGQGNVISGNAGAGVAFVGDSTDRAVGVLQANFIGTDSKGTKSLPNTGSGVSINYGKSLVGGSATGLGNTIMNNGGDGVTVLAGSGNAIIGNSISSNKKLGIDLKGNGVTPNRPPGTPDSKLPNLGQNFPELLSAQVASGKTTVTAILKAAPTTKYRIEFFLNATRDASGFGEGQKFISAVDVTTDSSGTAKFATTLSVALSGTQFLSMTATDPNSNTSEFSGISRVITGRVYITVTDPKNAKATIKQGLPNVRVERLDSKNAVKEATGTDTDGNYVFVGVPDGTWTIKPSSKTGTYDTQFDPATLKAAVSASKPAVSGLDFTTYSIFGTVKEASGKPLANKTVSLIGLGRSVKTASNGTYRFDGLGKGQYDVEFGDDFSPKFKIVTLPTSGTSGVSPNAQVDAQQGLSISGFVEDANGKPLANVPVQLVGTNISPVVTDSTGRYEFEGLLVGSYKVAPAASAGKFTPAYRTVTLKDKAVDSIDFTKVPATTKEFSGSGGDS